MLFEQFFFFASRFFNELFLNFIEKLFVMLVRKVISFSRIDLLNEIICSIKYF